MSQFSVDPRLRVELERPGLDTLEGRASLALKILAAFHVAGVVFALIPPLLPISKLLTASFNAAAALLAVVYLVEARGLDRRRPWAVEAVRPMLVLVAASSVGAVVVANADGKLRIPFELIPVAWALLGARDRHVPPIPRFAVRGALLTGVAVGAIAVMVFGRGWFGWGGQFDVHDADLQASVQVDCGPAGAGPPATIRVTYGWSWTSTSPLPNAGDLVIIGWSGDDSEGHPLYLLDATVETGTGVYPGGGEYPSIDMAREVATRFEGSFRWRAELEQQQYQPGHITIELVRRQADSPAPNPLTIGATYVHLGLWHKEAPDVTCAW
jgi:hypothetical protein